MKDVNYKDIYNEVYVMGASEFEKSEYDMPPSRAPNSRNRKALHVEATLSSGEVLTFPTMKETTKHFPFNERTIKKHANKEYRHRLGRKRWVVFKISRKE